MRTVELPAEPEAEVAGHRSFFASLYTTERVDRSNSGPLASPRRNEQHPATL